MVRRKGFTMIELVFVIVIIGMLASVSIPKLAANRTDAESSVCTAEVTHFLNGVTSSYAFIGFSKFKNLGSVNFTNLSLVNSAPTTPINAFLNAKVDTDGVDFYCYGEQIINFKGSVVASGEYNLTVTVKNIISVSNPSSKKAITKIKENILNNKNVKIFSL